VPTPRIIRLLQMLWISLSSGNSKLAIFKDIKHITNPEKNPIYRIR
jgi:hypothetical protein